MYFNVSQFANADEEFLRKLAEKIAEEKQSREN